ncbi:hypothetical protein AUJ93_00600 [bacterium CG2_30_33_46]|nr:MAG: hypothetical protein AUJ93_00600 [bacterium CG2_30_33_46]
MITKKEILNSRSLQQINNLVSKCKRCDLYKTKKCDVSGEGNSKASILFIGEGPGKAENKTGRPFVGRAGKFLDSLLGSININRKDIFITNLIKHWPPDNRKPKRGEIGACFPYLETQIRIVNPTIIVLLGGFSFNVFFPSEQISKEHGKFLNKDSRDYLALYHPAAAIYNNNLTNILMNDFQKLKKYENYNKEKNVGKDR